MSDTKSLPSRQPSASEQEVIDEVLSLYQAKPTEKSYSHYAENAVFHDPVLPPLYPERLTHNVDFVNSILPPD